MTWSFDVTLMTFIIKSHQEQEYVSSSKNDPLGRPRPPMEMVRKRIPDRILRVSSL